MKTKLQNPKNSLIIKNLFVSADKKEILKGINLQINSGEIHAIMGPNGSGKSTLLNTIMGHPNFKIKSGEILFNKTNICKMKVNKRANLGLFLAFQNPVEIPGVNIRDLLQTASSYNNEKIQSPLEVNEELLEKIKKLKLKENLIERGINENFSGGEKKKSEILQMAIIKPKIALIDEIDSGLDIDALKIVAKNIREIYSKNSPGILIVTHYQRILSYINPHFVHIISDGKIIKSGTKKLAQELEKNGYEKYIK
jgi:Fe-S cluster assembly ATP-binding protein